MTSLKLETSAHIDWVSVTAPIDDKNFLPSQLSNVRSKVTDGMFGYRNKRKYVNDVVVLSEPKNAKLGTHIIYGGRALHKIKSGFGDDFEVLRWHAIKGHKITRLDMAIDVIDSGLDRMSLLRQFNKRDCKTRIRSKPKAIISSETNVETLYLGSQSTRDKIIRVYDKAEERKLKGVDWVRIEYEVRQDNAVRATEYLCENGINKGNFASLIRGFCHFHNDETWCQIMDAEPVELPTFVEPANNTLKWLMESCAPALAREILANRLVEQEFYDKVSSEMLKYLEDYEK